MNRDNAQLTAAFIMGLLAILCFWGFECVPQGAIAPPIGEAGDANGWHQAQVHSNFDAGSGSGGY